MPFNSIRYVLFLMLVVLLYWRLPMRFRRPLLLVASYFFYMDCIPQYGLLIFFLTVANYWYALRVSTAKHWRKAWLWLAIITNLGILGFFKYTNFLIGNACSMFGLFGKSFSFEANILLPLGISFFTFEFIHYIVDVYRGNQPVRSWLDFALFPSFFPTQIAGPIKRYENFIPQLSNRQIFDTKRFQDGLCLIIRGMFMKVVLADNLSAVVQAGFGSPNGLGAADTWIAVIAFTLQIYFDFSGYTNIGRGSAKLLGFDVPENFNLPYLATDIADFWRRWHISLSSWLRDYLYIPLGGNRNGQARTYLNMFLTMSLGGLWHGASWTFVIWGALHGVGLVLNREWQRRTMQWKAAKCSLIWRMFAWAITLIFVCVGWVFFRATTLTDAFLMLQRMTIVGAPRLLGNLNPDHWLTTIIITGSYGLYLGIRWWLKSAHRPVWIQHNAWVGRAVINASLVLAVLAFPGGKASFIYFRF